MLSQKRSYLSGLMAFLLIASMVIGSGPAGALASTTPGGTLPPLEKTLKRIDTQLIIRFAGGVATAQAGKDIRATGGSLKKSSPFHNTRMAQYSTAAAARNALPKLRSNKRVVSAFYNQRFELPKDMSKPDLTAFPGRYTGALPGRSRPGGSGPGRNASADGLRTSEWHLDRIGQPLAPAVEANAPIVAVIDTGMDYNHPDLAQAYQRCPVVPGLYCDLIGYDQDPMDGNLHGTHVSGTIGARADGQGVTGVSPNSKILPVRIFDDAGYTDLMTIFQALDYTALAKLRLPNLKVANMSWGGYVLANSREHQEFNARLRAMRSAGILPVASAGNDSDFLLQAYPLILGREIAVVPAMSGSTLAVAATDQNDYRTFFSNYSTPINVNKCQNRTRYGECLARNEYTRKWYTFVPIAAPGWNVLSTGTEGQILQLSGTSMASPIVAGAAARVMARYPGMSVDQVAIHLRDTGQPLGKAQGFPLPTRRLDLRRALGVGGTGITGRVVDGVSGKPLAGVQVSTRDGARTVGATSNASGFYTLKNLRGDRIYTIRGSKTSPKYIFNTRAGKTIPGRYADPGDLSLAPSRTDGAYTMMLEWKNVLSGIDEYFRELFFNGPSGRYPWPVDGNDQPFSLMDSEFGVPFPDEPTDSVEFTWWNPGTMAAFPYARFMHDSEFDLSPHEGVIVRRTPSLGSIRLGVRFFSPAGVARPRGTVTLYRNGTLLKKSNLSASDKPTDGTAGNGKSGYSVWGLYNISSRNKLSMPTANGNGQRSEYSNWLSRNNDIQGVTGPLLGKSVTRELNVRFDESGVLVIDQFDVYKVQLVAGKTYNFNTKREGYGGAGTRFRMILYRPGSRTIFSDGGVKDSTKLNATTDVMTYKVPAGKSGQYYVLVYTYEGRDEYTLSRPTK